MHINTKNWKSVTLVDQVEEKILDFIKDNKLVPGDSLPNETELATSLEVGRSVVREALSRIRMLGIIETRTRRGMIIREPKIIGILNKTLNPYLLEEDTIIDLLGFRISLEIGITDLIFNNITKEDINELEKILKIQKVLSGNKLTIKSELAFHSKLYKITQNKIILDVQSIILPLFTFLNENFDEFVPFNESFSKKRKLIKHEDLLTFLKNGDREGYRVAILKHLESYVEFIKEKREKKIEN